MNKNWVIREADENAVNQLKNELKINKVLCKLLVSRGIATFDEAKKFFRPSLDNLHDPFLMKDMDIAISRIEKAMVNGEKILVYGDYDVDGTTSVALVYGFLREFYKNVGRYIPDRYQEGYGVSYQSIDFAAENGISLIIALDCGIKAIDKVAYAKEKGIDYIICDHHRPGPEIPAATAVLDPKREDCEYPYTELSGCGIGFKLIQAFAQKNDVPFKYIEKFLDLVAVSIAADIVPINDENRVLAYFGLKQLNESPRHGLKALVNVSGAQGKKLNISDIVFIIGPRVNAAGRLGNAIEAVDLLVAESSVEADTQASYLEFKNNERRNIDKSITEEAFSIIQDDTVLVNRKTTVIHRPHWHKGVIGIVASRLIEHYYRPTIVLTTDNGKVSGSARSVKGFDIYNALKECEDLVEQFGGHKYAAGLTMLEENVPAFAERFEKVVAATISDQMLTPEVLIDAVVDISELNSAFYKILRQFSPFGPANMTPIFMSKNVYDTGYASLVGQDRKHLKLQVIQNGSYPMDAIGFNLGKYYDIIADGPFDVCYQLAVNEWRGNKTLQLIIKDIKVSDSVN